MAPRAQDGARLVAEGLACGYAAGRPVVAVDLAAEAGRACLVVGRSGSGRSTLAQALAGFMPRLTGGWRRGRVALAQPGGACVEQADVPPADWLAQVGWYGAPPRAGLTGARRTVMGEIAFALEQRGLARTAIAQRAASTLEAIGLAGLAGRDPRTLSDGETARLALGGILVAEPAALVLDDAEAYLDGAGLRDLLGLLGGDDRARRPVVLATARPAALADVAPGWLAAADALVLVDGGVPAAPGPAVPTLSAEDLARHGMLPCLSGAPEGPAPARDERADGCRSPVPDAPDAAGADDAWGGVLAPAGGPLDVVLDDVIVAYDDEPAVRGVSIAARAGTVTALVGANGGGKTTLLRAMAGLVSPSNGRVRIGDADPARIARAVAARRVALVGSRPEDQAAARTVAADVGLGLAWTRAPRPGRGERVRAVLAAAGLAAQARDHPQELFAGARRWRAIASALVLRPPVVLLDEPTVGLDADGQRRLEDAIGAWRRQGRTIIVASHDLDFVAEVADRVVVVAGGRVRADGAPAAVLADAAALAPAALVPPARMVAAARLGVPPAGHGSRAALWRALRADRRGAERYNGGVDRPAVGHDVRREGG